MEILQVSTRKGLVNKMEYSAGSVKYLLWYVETKDTAKLLQNNSFDEIKTMAIEENLYQQNSADRRKSEYGCIRRRLEAIPEDLIKKLIKADIQTAKIITFIACMMTDRLLFELMYEVYRNKVHYGENSITDADLNIFMQNKREQSEKVAKWTDVSVNKLKQTYSKYMFEVGLIAGKTSEKKITPPYIDPELREILLRNQLEKYLYALTGEM